MPTALVILAAGQGSRMESDLPKVLHKLAGAPLLAHAMRAGQPLEPERVIVVAGHGSDLVRKAAQEFDDSVEIVLQSEQLGTSHAVDQARASLADFDGTVIVLYGDTPFIRPETLQAMLDKHAEGNAVVVLGFEAANPGRYGRLIVTDGHLREIVEAKEATPAQLAVTLCNSGVICADSAVLFDLISKVKNDNASGEFYLTDIIGLANKAQLRCATVTCDEAETLGINTRAELAGAEAAFQIRARREALENGATLTAPDTVWLAYDTLMRAKAPVGIAAIPTCDRSPRRMMAPLPYCFSIWPRAISRACFSSIGFSWSPPEGFSVVGAGARWLIEKVRQGCDGYE